MRNGHAEAHRHQSPRNKSYQRRKIDVAKHPMTQRHVAASPSVSKRTRQTYRQSDGRRSADRELGLHASGPEIRREQRTAADPGERRNTTESQTEDIQSEVASRQHLQRG